MKGESRYGDEWHFIYESIFATFITLPRLYTSIKHLQENQEFRLLCGLSIITAPIFKFFGLIDIIPGWWIWNGDYNLNLIKGIAKYFILAIPLTLCKGIYTISTNGNSSEISLVFHNITNVIKSFFKTCYGLVKYFVIKAYLTRRKWNIGTLCKISKNANETFTYEIKMGGAHNFGSEEFTNYMVDVFVCNFQRMYNRNMVGRSKNVAIRRLKNACEQAISEDISEKIERGGIFVGNTLATGKKHIINLPLFYEGKDFKVTIKNKIEHDKIKEIFQNPITSIINVCWFIYASVINFIKMILQLFANHNARDQIEEVPDPQIPNEENQIPNEESQIPNEENQIPNEENQIPNEESQNPNEENQNSNGAYGNIVQQMSPPNLQEASNNIEPEENDFSDKRNKKTHKKNKAILNRADQTQENTSEPSSSNAVDVESDKEDILSLYEQYKKEKQDFMDRQQAKNTNQGNTFFLSHCFRYPLFSY